MMDAIFIVGTGRSETHFTLRSLLGFSEVFDPQGGHEDLALLYHITRSAILHQPFPPHAHSYYSLAKKMMGSRKIFADQHHSNLYFRSHLTSIFQSPIFLYVKRPLEQIVASMLEHQGVQYWYHHAIQKQNRIPLPNQFLGIESLEEINKTPKHILFAKRVLAHHAEAKSNPNHVDLRFINYTDLVLRQEEEFSRIFSTMEIGELGTFTAQEKPNAASLSKYKDVLTSEQVKQIQSLAIHHGY